MNYINKDYSAYMHTYEAYRVQKDRITPDAVNRNMVVGEDENSLLILTEKSKKQMDKDRFDYSNILMLDAQMASAKTQEEATKQQNENMAKIWSVFRSMCKGDFVPASDERKLMEYDDKMYQMAKQAQLIAMNEDRKKKKSEWDEDEEKAKKDKLDGLKSEADAALQNMSTGSAEFAEAQSGNIVEVPAEGFDVSV